MGQMSHDLLGYLLKDLREHVDHLQELCETENPDSERVEYHHSKAINILDLLDEGAAVTHGNGN